MKKSFITLLLALAVIVLVSPRIVGQLAEQSMDDNLTWAATETDAVEVTALGFDRGWFSSQGRHRLEIKAGELRDSLLALTGGADALPALIVDTHIDHGLVPVSSIGRERGSLAPGLGRAVSRLSLEFENGATTEVPAIIYSHVGLTGGLESNLVVAPGSFEVDNETAHWGSIDVLVTTNAPAGAVGFSGTIDQVLLVSAANEIELANIEFDGEQEQTHFGFAVGDATLSIETIAFPSDYGQANTGPWRIMSDVSLDDDLLSARTVIETEYMPLGELGPAGLGIDISFEGVDAGALSRVSRALDDFDSYGSDDAFMQAVEHDLRTILATGFRMRLDRLELAMPPGTISATLNMDVLPTVVDRFTWAAMLPALDAELALSVPVEFYDYLVAIDPQVSMAANMGFLRRNGNVYEMQAVLKDGRLAVNGAPMPVPLPGDN